MRQRETRIQPARRQWVYDDGLHQRRRHLAIVRPPIDVEGERLRRLQDHSRETRDP